MKKPDNIGKYNVLELIGQGSDGDVYKAFDTVIERHVALKVVRPDMLNRPGMMHRFKKEVQAQGRVLHPNVVAIFDVTVYNDCHVIVMEYVNGRQLREIMDYERLVPLRRFYRFAGQICRGIAFANRQGIVHRDIKPENILITEDDHVKILDFSVAKLDTAPTSVSSGSFLLGSLHYMSPEQALGLPVSSASDQFSVAVLCYEMLAGRLPFTADTVADGILAITKQNPKPITEFNPMVDEGLNRVILKALSKEPGVRFATLSRFRSQLRDHLASLEPSLVLEDEDEY